MSIRRFWEAHHDLLSSDMPRALREGGVDFIAALAAATVVLGYEMDSR
jgi:hypothetical protein